MLHGDVGIKVLGVLECLLADVALVVLLAQPLLVDVLAVLDVLGALVERLAAQLAVELVLLVNSINFNLDKNICTVPGK